jgi:hypothetical protein
MKAGPRQSASASEKIPTLNSLKNSEFRMGHPQGGGPGTSFPRASTGKSNRPQVLHKGGGILCCGTQYSDGKWVQRNVRVPVPAGRLRRSQWQPAIFVRRLPRGYIQKRAQVRLVARALRPLPRTCSSEQAGRWPRLQLRVPCRKTGTGKSAPAKAALLRERCRAEAGRRAACAVTRAGAGIHEPMRSKVAGLGPHSI